MNARTTRRGALKVGVGSALAVLGVGSLRAQAATKITISYPTRSGASWPLWIAKHAGLYEKHGMDVTLEFGVHPAGVAMLVSGQAQMLNYGLDQILVASAREPSMVMMGSSLNKGSFALIAQKEFKKVSDLKGKRVGIGRLGDPLYTFTLDLLQKYNMGAQDVQWIPTGRDARTRAGMLVNGQLDASLMVAPSYFKLEAQGFSVVDLLANYADIYVSTAYTFMKTWVKDNPDVPRRLIMAHAEAIKRFYDDKAYAVKAYQAYDPGEEQDTARIYDIYREREVLDRVPLLQKAAVASAVTRQLDDVPALKALDPAQVIDMGPVRKLVAEGYFRDLFGPGVAGEEQKKLAASY
jgi:ABC-type nitrate/sulfonate/bicarbonate transport system substrate-binding protein